MLKFTMIITVIYLIEIISKLVSRILTNNANHGSCTMCNGYPEDHADDCVFILAEGVLTAYMKVDDNE